MLKFRRNAEMYQKTKKRALKKFIFRKFYSISDPNSIFLNQLLLIIQGKKYTWGLCTRGMQSITLRPCKEIPAFFWWPCLRIMMITPFSFIKRKHHLLWKLLRKVARYTAFDYSQSNKQTRFRTFPAIRTLSKVSWLLFHA